MIGTADQAEPAWHLRAAPSYARAIALGVFLLPPLSAVVRGLPQADNQIVVAAARLMLRGGSPYADKRLLYPPSSLLPGLLEAQLPYRVVETVGPFLVAVGVLTAWWLALRIFDVSPRSWLGVLVVGGLGVSEPYLSLVATGNWSLSAVVAMPAALLLASRDRWVAAGLVVGLSVALKPMLVPVWLLFVAARRWRALALAAGVPLAASAVGATLVPHLTELFTRTLPFLLSGQDRYASLFDASLPAVLARLHVPAILILTVRVAVGLAGLAVAWWRWRKGGDDRLRLVETASVVMISVFLVSTPAFVHYLPVVVLPLLASLGARGLVPRSPWFWVGLVPQLPTVSLPDLQAEHRRAFRDAFTLAMLFVATARECLRPAPSAEGSSAPVASGERPVSP